MLSFKIFILHYVPGQQAPPQDVTFAMLRFQDKCRFGIHEITPTECMADLRLNTKIFQDETVQFDLIDVHGSRLVQSGRLRVGVPAFPHSLISSRSD